MNNTEAIDAFCKANGVKTEIHTFAGWLKRGYKVKKGEKSSFAFPLWSHSEKKGKEKQIETFSPHMAHFFTKDQVEPKLNK